MRGRISKEDTLVSEKSDIDNYSISENAEQHKQNTIRNYFIKYFHEHIETFIMNYMSTDEFPICLDAILDTLGFSLYDLPEFENNSEEIVCMLVIGNSGAGGIFIKKSLPIKEQRFVAIYSILYCFKQHDRLEVPAKPFYEYDFKGNNIDTQILNYASEVLVPQKWLEDALKRLKKPKPDILSDLFNAPIPILERRLDAEYFRESAIYNY